eukprot:Lankesteria_metandrocarpae@DN3713_c0_g2_i1.p1
MTARVQITELDIPIKLDELRLAEAPSTCDANTEPKRELQFRVRTSKGNVDLSSKTSFVTLDRTSVLDEGTDHIHVNTVLNFSEDLPSGTSDDDNKLSLEVWMTCVGCSPNGDSTDSTGTYFVCGGHVDTEKALSDYEHHFSGEIQLHPAGVLRADISRVSTSSTTSTATTPPANLELNAALQSDRQLDAHHAPYDAVVASSLQSLQEEKHSYPSFGTEVPLANLKKPYVLKGPTVLSREVLTNYPTNTSTGEATRVLLNGRSTGIVGHYSPRGAYGHPAYAVAQRHINDTLSVANSVNMWEVKSPDTSTRVIPSTIAHLSPRTLTAVQSTAVPYNYTSRGLSTAYNNVALPLQMSAGIQQYEITKPEGFPTAATVPYYDTTTARTMPAAAAQLHVDT